MKLSCPLIVHLQIFMHFVFSIMKCSKKAGIYFLGVVQSPLQLNFIVRYYLMEDASSLVGSEWRIFMSKYYRLLVSE